MPKSEKPSETKAAPAAKRSVVAKAAGGAAKAASGSTVSKKPITTIASKDNNKDNSEAAPEPASPAKKVGTAAHHGKVAAPARHEVVAEDDQPRPDFLVEQRVLLYEERASYTRQAEELKAQADSLALEHEPGDVQFDEEGGEGGTSNVDRELDLVLSAQARAAIAEIDRALAKVDAGNYGVCEQCGQDIPQARLKALPYAALCVGCKSGGLSRRS